MSSSGTATSHGAQEQVSASLCESGQRPLLLVTLFAVLVSLVLDSQVRFHLGDSDTFLHTYWPDRLPPDRSWLYGLFVGRSAALFRDLSIIPKLQIATAAGGALLLAIALQRRLAVPTVLLCMMVVLAVFDPLAAWWARSIMSDSMASAMLCVLLAVSIWPGLSMPARVLIVFLCALSAFFLRSVHTVPFVAAAVFYLTVCWLGGCVLPSLASARREAFCVAFGIVAAVVSYAAANTSILRAPDFALNHQSARFLLGAVVPLLDGQEALIPLPAERLAQLPPLTREMRIAHTFAPEGIVEQLYAQYGAEAEVMAHQLVRRAIVGAPWQAIALWATTWAEYLAPRDVIRSHQEARYSGATSYNQPNRLSNDTMERLRELGIWQNPRDDWPQLQSMSLRWFRVMGGVSALVLAWGATLALPLVLLTRLRRVPAAWLMAAVAAATMGFMTATVNAYVSRYLIAIQMPLLALWAIGLGPLVARLICRAQPRP